MPRRIDQLAKSVRVIIGLCDKCVNACNNYSELEREILTDFIDTFKAFNDQPDPIKNTIYRKRLYEDIERFLERYPMGGDVYLNYSFLWFACTFFEKFRSMLISEKTFFPIVIETMRAVTKHLRQCEKLDNIIIWESLQIFSNKKIFRFLHELYQNELELLINLHNLLDLGLIGLNPKRIKLILKEGIIKGKRTFNELIYTYLDLIGPLWSIDFDNSAFNLENYFVRIQSSNLVKLKESVNFQKNSVLNFSIFYNLIDTDINEFIGIYIIPKDGFYDFYDYLTKKKDQGLIDDFSVKRIVNTKTLVSYKYYKQGEGWIYTDSNESDNNPSFSSEKWNTKWNYKRTKEPIKYIESFCYSKGDNLFRNLEKFIGNVGFRFENKSLFKEHSDRMKEMFNEGAVKLNLIPYGLILSFSLSRYLITIPKDFKEIELYNLTTILPLSYIYFLKDKSIRIITNLNQQLLSLLKENFDIKIENIVINTQSKNPQLDNFDINSISWRLNI